MGNSFAVLFLLLRKNNNDMASFILYFQVVYLSSTLPKERLCLK